MHEQMPEAANRWIVYVGVPVQTTHADDPSLSDSYEEAFARLAKAVDARFPLVPCSGDERMTFGRSLFLKVAELRALQCGVPLYVVHHLVTVETTYNTAATPVPEPRSLRSVATRMKPFVAALCSRVSELEHGSSLPVPELSDLGFPGCAQCDSARHEANPRCQYGDLVECSETPGIAGSPATSDDPIPDIVRELAAEDEAELVWRNELGGLTFRIIDRFVKWNPRSTGIDLEREGQRLEWISPRHPVPQVIAAGADDEAQWLVTVALPGECAVGDMWRTRPSEAIRAIATGLRAIHAISIDAFPAEWTSEVWVGRTPASLGPRPPLDDPVLVHGDACAPNTLISEAGDWVGNVDFGDLAVGDRWADLAVASMSLDWNFGEGHQHEFFDDYGIESDKERIRYYRELWHLES